MKWKRCTFFSPWLYNDRYIKTADELKENLAGLKICRSHLIFILLAWFVFISPVSEKGHCKSVQSSSVCSRLSYNETFIILRIIPPCSQSIRAHLMAWWGWKWCKSYAIALTATRSMGNFGSEWASIRNAEVTALSWLEPWWLSVFFDHVCVI